jgi:hypothetical protein
MKNNELLPQGKSVSLKEINAAIESFYHSDDKVLVLSSFDASLRDQWFLQCASLSKEVPIEKWAHSSRISKIIEERTGVELKSIYQTIYGGIPKKTTEREEADSEENEKTSVDENESAQEPIEGALEVVPIRDDKDLPINALIVVHEAHLISSTMVVNDMIVFGTGKLLDDLLTYLELNKNKRKIVFIGDPYLLTFGKHSETALNYTHLSGLTGRSIKALTYHEDMTKLDGIHFQRAEIARSIDMNTFNNLKYHWNDTLIEVDKEKAKDLMISWFGNAHSFTNNHVLVYTNNEASKINKWVKTHLLKNGEELSSGDLLLTQNNIYVPDPILDSSDKNLYNGTFLKVIEVDKNVETISNKKNKVKLEYLPIKVKALKGSNSEELNLVVLLNFFNNDELIKDEIIALRILANERISQMKKESPFEISSYNQKLESLAEYTQAVGELKRLNLLREKGEKVTNKSIEEQEKIIKRLTKKAKKEYTKHIKHRVVREDKYLNAIHVRYGWGMTVHKSIGFHFDNIIFNANSDSLNGYHNRGYFNWLYSGLSSANNVYLTNPKIITPLDGCIFIDNVETSSESASKTGKNLALTFDNYMPSSTIKDKAQDDYNSNILACIDQIAQALSLEGVVLEEVIKKDAYLYKAHFSLPNQIGKNAIIALNNNAKMEVSSVRIEKCSSSEKTIFERAISQLFENSNTQTEMLEGFRKEIYNKWIALANSLNLTLNIENCHNYHDFLRLRNNVDSVLFKVTYDGSGFFKSIEVLKKTNNALALQLKTITTDEH